MTAALVTLLALLLALGFGGFVILGALSDGVTRLANAVEGQNKHYGVGEEAEPVKAALASPEVGALTPEYEAEIRQHVKVNDGSLPPWRRDGMIRACLAEIDRLRETPGQT